MAIPVAVIGDQVGPGKITGVPAATVKINKKPVALTPGVVSSHGSDAHASATIPKGKITKLKVEKKPVIGDGDNATCGDVVVAANKKVTAS